MKTQLLTAAALLITLVVQAQQPSVEWANGIGTFKTESSDVAADASGNVYMLGNFTDTVDFNPGSNTFTMAAANPTAYPDNVFILKTNAQGSFVWARQFSGTRDVIPESIKLDASGNIYTCGHFDGIADFDPGPGTYTLGMTQAYSGFVSKLDNAGNFVWAKEITYNWPMLGLAMDVDPPGNVYLSSAYSDSTDLDPGPAIYHLSQGNFANYLLKLNSSGSFVWAKNCVPSQAMAADAGGNIFTTGSYAGIVDFDLGPGTYTMATSSSVAATNGFLMKLDNTGNFLWAKSMDAVALANPQSPAQQMFAFPQDICLDPTGNLYITGDFNGLIDFDPGQGIFNVSSSTLSPHPNDVFVLKTDLSGNFQWAKAMIADTLNSSAYFSTIAADNNGSAYIAGSFLGNYDFDPGAATYTLAADNSDVFIVKLSAAGAFQWVKKLGGLQSDEGQAVAVNNSFDLFLSGDFVGGENFDAGVPGAAPLVGAAYGNMFLCKIAQPDVTGIKESALLSEIHVYPNPASGIFNLQLPAGIGNLTMEVYSSNGVLIQQQRITSASPQVDLSHADNGLYLLKIKKDNAFVAVQKLVKE